MPSSASARASLLARSRPLASSASLRGSRSPAISAATIATADLAFIPSLATEVILTMASSSSFSSRCRHRVRSRTRSVPGPGEVPHRPDRGRRHEAGAQHAPLGQPGQPHRIQPVGLRPPFEVLGL